VPWGFQEELAALRRPSPILGQHTREVLRETGYADAEIDRLIASHTVRTS
jgi:crotonobetainyl-CoA:carnitine CoA-transferase CaiB-like acyl-CoA transferase